MYIKFFFSKEKKMEERKKRGEKGEGWKGGEKMDLNFQIEDKKKFLPDVLSINSIKPLHPAQVHSSHLTGTPAQTHGQQTWFWTT